MNARLLFKTLFLIAILGLLVLMGMNNRSSVEVALAPILSKPISLPAALMYFAFFGIGLLTGTILHAGGRAGGSSGGKGAK
jgi:uncharacterized integral membrane protein